MIETPSTRTQLLQEVAALNESFARGALPWQEWLERVSPLLRALNPELHREELRESAAAS